MIVNSKVGEIIMNLRTQKHISQSRLCQGLCSVSTLSRYERRERIPPRIILNSLIQRLGGSTEYIITSITESEYSYFLWKRSVLQAINTECMEQLTALLKSPAELHAAGTIALQKQFEYEALSYISEFEKKYPDSISLLKKAINMTLPGFEDGIDNYLLSTGEALLIVRLSELYLKDGQDECAQTLLKNIIIYSEEHYDSSSLIAVFPPAVKLLAPILIRENNLKCCKELCHKAIELIRKAGTGSNLRELLEYYICCDKDSEYSAKCQKWLWTLDCIYDEYGETIKRSSSFEQEIYLLEEMIKDYRESKGWSQEETSDGLFSTRMLSYSENGDHSLSFKNFYSVRDKLSMNEDYFNPQLETTDYFSLEKFQKVYREITVNNYDRALIDLGEVEKRLNSLNEMNEHNLKLLEVLYTQIRILIKEIDSKQLIPICEKLLKCKFDTIFEETYWKKFVSKPDADLLNFIALYIVQTNREKAIYIWEHILKKLESSYISLSERISTSMTIIGNLSTCYGALGRFQECIDMCLKGIDLCLQTNKYTILGRLIGDKSESLICLKNDKESNRKYFQQAYYLMDMYNVTKSTAYYDSFYRKNYSNTIKWY